MSRYDDDYLRRERPKSRRRDREADLAYSHEPAPPYQHTISMVDNESPTTPMPSAATYAYSPPPADGQGQQYGIVTRTTEVADISRSPARPRSMPPADVTARPRSSLRTDHYREKHRRGSHSDDSGDDYDRSPVDRARHFVNDNFSNSTTALGVGMLGALVGGLVAREAVELTGKHKSHHHDVADYKRNQMIGTVVGAAVGAIGANAFEKRLENNRERDRRRERWPANGVIERREVLARPRSRENHEDSRDWRDRDPINGNPKNRDRGVGREVDADTRSWKDVGDWVYDERKSGSLPSRATDLSDHHT